METVKYHISKAGPRLINILVDSPQIDCVITAPGMLIEELRFFTNQDVFSGCDASFYQTIANDLECNYYCGSKAPVNIPLKVEIHRLGPELVFNLGPVSMYQALIQIRTKSGCSLKQLITDNLSSYPRDPFIAVLHAVRANSHHEHNSASKKTIRDHASTFDENGGHNGH